MINAKGENKDYFKRFISLSFVNIIRLFVYMVIAMIPLGIAMYFLQKTGYAYATIQDGFKALISIGTQIVYYILMIQSFKRINEIRQAETHEPPLG